MKSKFTYLLLIGLILGTFSCQNSATQKEPATEVAATESTASTEDNALSKDGLTLTAMTDSPIFDKSALSLKVPANASNQATGKVKFAFDVADYDLGNQTADAAQNSVPILPKVSIFT